MKEKSLLEHLEDQDQLSLFLVETTLSSSALPDTVQKAQYFVRALSVEHAQTQALSEAKRDFEWKRGKKANRAQARAVPVKDPRALLKKTS